MTRLFSLVLASALASPLLAHADDAHHPAAKSPVKAGPTETKTTANAASPMMMDNMKKMQDQMAKMHAAKDPQERGKLMQEHMQTMQETMKMMHDSKGMMGCGKQDGKPMEMMQSMMDQMMEHQKAMQDAGK